MRLLDRYYDPALEVDLALTEKKLAAAEIARLQGELATALVASSVPRRLADATRDELALDKKRSRRVAHVLRQSLLAWGGKERAPTKEERQAGAQVDWLLWWEEREALLGGRLRHAASWAKRTSNLRAGKSAVVKLSQELEWLRYALRD